MARSAPLFVTLTRDCDVVTLKAVAPPNPRSTTKLQHFEQAGNRFFEGVVCLQLFERFYGVTVTKNERTASTQGPLA
jgi:hypothetical protein